MSDWLQQLFQKLDTGSYCGSGSTRTMVECNVKGLDFKETLETVHFLFIHDLSLNSFLKGI